METAKIKCPKCGKEALVIPEDLDKTDLKYNCDQCGETFEVSFFDHCPTCKVNVGFLEGNAFKKDMLSLGMDLMGSVKNPLSVIDSFGEYFKNAFVDNVNEANGDGVCPICHTRYIRCHSCHELQAIDLDAIYKDKFKCSHCGLLQFPGHVKDGREKLHSVDFFSSLQGNKLEKQCLQLHNRVKTEIEINPQVTTRLSRNEALKIISFVMHLPAEYINGEMSVSLGRSELKRFRKKGYDIPESIMYRCKSYNDLADVIIALKSKTSETTSSAQSLSSQKKQEQMLTQQTDEGQRVNVEKAEQDYLENIKDFLEDDAEITPRERRMLDLIRQKLGISEERAKELESSLSAPQLTEDEQEYLGMYREYAEKGEVTEKERRRLNKFAAAMGISDERMKEIEKI